MAAQTQDANYNEKVFYKYSTLTVTNESVRKRSDDASILKKQNSLKMEVMPAFGSAKDSSELLNEVKEE